MKDCIVLSGVSSWRFRRASAAASAAALAADSRAAKAAVPSAAAAAVAGWLPATVPGCIHTDLLDQALISDPYSGRNEFDVQWVGELDWEYECSFTATAGHVASPEQDLVFEGLDTLAEVRLNGQLLGETDNMYRVWRFPVAGILRAGENLLSVTFRNTFDRYLPQVANAPYVLKAANDQAPENARISPYVRKPTYQYGWDWGPRLVTAGIWKPLRLECHDGLRVEGFSIRTLEVAAASGADRAAKADAKCLALFDAHATRAGRYRMTITCKPDDGGAGGDAAKTAVVSRTIDLPSGASSQEVSFDMKDAALWWPRGYGEQALYRFNLEIAEVASGAAATAGAVTATATTRAGIRDVILDRSPDAHGIAFNFKVNGGPYFAKGACWVPPDNYPSRITKEWYRAAVTECAWANFDMLRAWGGGLYESEDFYDVCDELGILVWQDFQFACCMYPPSEEFAESVRAEAIDNVKRIRAHASLALWCGNNECETAWFTWGWANSASPEHRAHYISAYRRLYEMVIPEVVKELDSGRAYISSSPLAGFANERGEKIEWSAGDAHYWGVWHSADPIEAYEEKIARFMSEYGFQSHPDRSLLGRYLPEGSFAELSPEIVHRQRCGRQGDNSWGERNIRAYMDPELGAPRDFDSYLFMTQYLQSWAIRTAIGAHRRSAAGGLCGGSIYWQVNDCWPGTSWSSIDWALNRKALHYAARDAFAPLSLVIRETEGELEFWACSQGDSDRDADEELSLVAELVDLRNGTVLSRREAWKGRVGRDSSTRVASFGRKEILGKAKAEDCVLVARLETVKTGAPNTEAMNAGAAYATAVRLFSPAKDAALAEPGITLRRVERDGKAMLELSAAKPALGVRLAAALTAAPSSACAAAYGHVVPASGFMPSPTTYQFERNWFDLMPGAPVLQAWPFRDGREIRADEITVTSLYHMTHKENA